MRVGRSLFVACVVAGSTIGAEHEVVAFDVALKGHRHKSAAQFCAMQEKNSEHLALAIVVSQDGMVSVVAGRPNGLQIVRPKILRSRRLP